MKIRTLHESSFSITFSLKEIKIFQEVLKKNIELISDSEFKSRTGFTKIDMTRLSSNLKSHIERYFSKNESGKVLNQTMCFSSEEVIILHQSLNEVCHGIKIVSFEKEIGIAKEFLETYLNYIDIILLNYENTNNRVVGK